MLNVLDTMLRDLLIARVAQLTDDSQVGFEPPDDAWRTQVAGLSVGGNPVNALNVYLVDVVENRKLRSNERARTFENGWAEDQPAPARADCHYLVSAWSPATATPATTPTLDEHALLYEALAAFLQEGSIAAGRIYAPGSVELGAVPPLFREADMPLDVAAEAFPKLAEFWGAMGPNYRWKPALHLVVTVPVALIAQVAGPMVTTRITEYRLLGVPASGETWVQIGGHVLDATVSPPVPVPNAWVQIESMAGGIVQSAATNSLGRFTFGGLHRGPYRLRYSATGFAVPAPRLVDVPSPSGEYDLEFV
ncbi:MAG: Pvc16 family protein [Dehalococcoidia bacterium]